MNLDHLQQFPNQLVDGDPSECVALSVADIAGNIDSQLYDPDIIYAYTLRLMGQQPNTGGLDPYTGMLCPVVYGLLPISLETFTAKTMGELYVANYQNYTPDERIAALKWARRGVMPLYSYAEIAGYLSAYRTGVSLAVKWYESFNTPNQDGTLPAPVGAFSYHNVAVYEETDKGFRVKPWLGPQFGDGGYVYMSETTLELVYQSAYGFDPNAWRWLSLAKIAVTHSWDIIDILPILKTTS